jgi:internalin A
MPVIKIISVLFGILIFSVSALPIVAAPRQPVSTKSFAQWCEEKLSVSAETRKTINLLLEKAGTKNCRLANSNLKGLTILSLAYSQISDLEPLASLTDLTHLNLRLNQIRDVKPLASLTNLTELELRYNQIVDTKPLASLTKLTNLYLDNNQINDLVPLASLTKLTGLYLTENQIRDLEPLASLTKLTYLSLYGNQITNKICPIKPESICVF